MARRGSSLTLAERLAEVVRQRDAATIRLEPHLAALAFSCRRQLDELGFELLEDLRVESEFDAMGYWARTRHHFKARDGASGLAVQVTVMLWVRSEQDNLLHWTVLSTRAPHGELFQRSASTHVPLDAPEDILHERTQFLANWLKEECRAQELLDALAGALTP